METTLLRPPRPSDFPEADWQYEVANGDTTAGLLQWRASKLDQELDDQAEAHPPTFEHRTMTCLRINAPHWYRRADFAGWVNGEHEGYSPATWHRRGEPMGEFSDVFALYDGPHDGTDTPGPNGTGIPQDIWDRIVEEMGGKEVTQTDGGLIWISNLPE